MRNDNFFINSISGDDGYVTVRDHSSETTIRAKLFVEALWRQYCKHADKNFKTDAVNHFQQRFWEMYLGVTLGNHGLKISKGCAKGPEFFVGNDNKKIWFEAIAPSRGTGKDAVPKTNFKPVATEVPEEKIILRIRHAIFEKFKEYKEYISSKTIGTSDPYVIAINSKRIRPQTGEPPIPFIVKSVFPFGNQTIDWDVKSCTSVREYHSHRNVIFKNNEAPVSTSIFLDSNHNGISAVLYSSVDPANYPEEFGADFKIVHNPFAINPLPENFFKFGVNFWLEGTTLKSKKLA